MTQNCKIKAALKLKTLSFNPPKNYMMIPRGQQESCPADSSCKKGAEVKQSALEASRDDARVFNCTFNRPKRKFNVASRAEESLKASCRTKSATNWALLKSALRRVVIALATLRLTSTTTSTSTAATVTSSSTWAGLLSALLKSLLIGFYYIIAFTSLLMLILYINRTFHTNPAHSQVLQLTRASSSHNFDLALNGSLEQVNSVENNEQPRSLRKNEEKMFENITRTRRSPDVRTLDEGGFNNNNNTVPKPDSSKASSKVTQISKGGLRSSDGSSGAPVELVGQVAQVSESGAGNGGAAVTRVALVAKEEKVLALVNHDPLHTSASSSPILPQTQAASALSNADNKISSISATAGHKKQQTNSGAKNSLPLLVAPLPEPSSKLHAKGYSLNNRGAMNNQSAPLSLSGAGGGGGGGTTMKAAQQTLAEVQWIPILQPSGFADALHLRTLEPTIMSNNRANTKFSADSNNPQQRPNNRQQQRTNSNNKLNNQANSGALATSTAPGSSAQNLHLLTEASYRSMSETQRPTHAANNHLPRLVNSQLNQQQQQHHHHVHHHHHHHHNLPSPSEHLSAGSRGYQWRQPRLHAQPADHFNAPPRFTKMYKRILLCDKTLVSLDYVRNAHAPPPFGPHIPYEHPLSEPHYDFDADFNGDNVIDLDTNLDPKMVDRRGAPLNDSLTNNGPILATDASAQTTSQAKRLGTENRAEESLLVVEKRSYLADDDPLVKCDMWDLEKGLKNRKPPKEILQMAIRADFDTVRDAINRCRQLSEKTLPPDDDALRDGLEIMSTEDLISLFSMKRGLIPGTKWCGLGDQASSYNDLGSKHRIDICCRAHDHCPIRLKPFRNDYGVLNIALYTKSHCDCDADFYRCLREARSRTADMLGNLYFNVMKLQCMREERMKICREMK